MSIAKMLRQKREEQDLPIAAVTLYGNGRVVAIGDVDDVAAAAVYLASDLSGFVTGTGWASGVAETRSTCPFGPPAKTRRQRSGPSER